MTRALTPFAVLFVAISLPTRAAHADDRRAEPPAQGQPAQAPPGRTPVSVESDHAGTHLVRYDFLGSGYHYGFYDVAPICTAPCRTSVSAGDSYRVVGPGITPSDPFALRGNAETDLRVRAGSWPAHVAGLTLTILGAAYVPTGAGMLAGQEAFGDARSRALVPIGATFLGVGVVALAVGLPLLLGSRTDVSIQSALASAGTQPPP